MNIKIIVNKVLSLEVKSVAYVVHIFSELDVVSNRDVIGKMRQYQLSRSCYDPWPFQ